MRHYRQGFYTAGKWLANISRVAIILTTLQWLLVGNQIPFTVGMVSVALTYVPSLLIRNRMLQTATNISVSMLLAAHVVLGMQYGLYETSAIYDKWLHVIGSGAITALVIVAVLQYCTRIRLELPVALFVILVLGATISMGTLWEVFEFSVDRTGLFQAQRGLSDTMLDLIADTIGVLGTLALYLGSVSFRSLMYKTK
ncbi:MAG: hypothetical protein OER96_08625 [Gammaproteobacteria bacterium]|nr:hypothetical protein [Gammaproteobacteria bacterium]